jgi:hypothetical protein
MIDGLINLLPFSQRTAKPSTINPCGSSCGVRGPSMWLATEINMEGILLCQIGDLSWGNYLMDRSLSKYRV